jgi:hypothetical protein
MPKLFFLLLLVIFCQSAFSQINHPKNKQELIAVCDKFMDTFKGQKYNEAFDIVKPYTVIEDYKLDTLAKKAEHQMMSLSGVYGKMMSFEQISEKPVKTSLSKLIYILKFEKYFLKFRFILYNNGVGWTIINLKYDDEIDELF